MTDDIEKQRLTLRLERDEAGKRAATFASTTPLKPHEDAPVMSAEGMKAIEKAMAAQKALKDFEESHPRSF